MAENLETQTYDPWNLLGKKYNSKCCKGKMAEIIIYDHTGATMVECECGKQYWHNEGAYKFDTKFYTVKGLENF